MLLLQPAFAQTTLPDAGLLPDNAFYPLKRVFESIDMAFTFDPADRVDKDLRYAELRVAEADALVRQGKPQFVESVMADYNDHIYSARADSMRITDHGERITAFAAIAAAIDGHIAVLGAVKAQAPAEAQAGLQTAIDKAQQARP